MITDPRGYSQENHRPCSAAPSKYSAILHPRDLTSASHSRVTASFSSPIASRVLGLRPGFRQNLQQEPRRITRNLPQRTSMMMREWVSQQKAWCADWSEWATAGWLMARPLLPPTPTPSPYPYTAMYSCGIRDNGAETPPVMRVRPIRCRRATIHGRMRISWGWDGRQNWPTSGPSSHPLSSPNRPASHSCHLSRSVPRGAE